MGFENRARPSPDFEALTRQHKDAVYRQMLRVCDNREDAEDVLVEALLKAHRQRVLTAEPPALVHRHLAEAFDAFGSVQRAAA